VHLGQAGEGKTKGEQTHCWFVDPDCCAAHTFMSLLWPSSYMRLATPPASSPGLVPHPAPPALSSGKSSAPFSSQRSWCQFQHHVHSSRKPNRIQLVLFGMQNRTLGAQHSSESAPTSSPRQGKLPTQATPVGRSRTFGTAGKGCS
jgi:hypothetical protein